MSNSDKIQYLQMIQEVIGRMSTISSVVKGFLVAIVGAIATIICADFVEGWMVWIFSILLITLFMLDVYYLHLEKQYRVLYENVRTDKHPVDFSLTITSDEAKEVKLWKCVMSKSILLFHIPMLLMYLIVCICVR